MTYRKFKADYLFTGHHMMEAPSVLVTTGEGRIKAIVSPLEAGEDVEVFRGILCPGFINCHCHLELSHMKGLIAEKTGMVDFLLAVMQQRTADPDRIAQAIGEAEQDMLDHGIVAVGDICNTTDTLSRKREGHMYYHNFIEAAGFVPQAAVQRFEASREVFSQFASLYDLPVESNSMVPHAPYSVSGNLFGMITQFPGNHLLTIHNQESEEENEFMTGGTGSFLQLYRALGLDISFYRPSGKRSLAGLLPYFYSNQSLILVHNVSTREEDLRSVEESAPAGLEIYYCLCPGANRYITGMLPDIGLLVSHGCKLVLGTDSLASNHQLDLLSEIKILRQQYPRLDTETLLGWATHNGARALQLDATLGSFRKGNQPGVLLLEDTRGPQITEATRVRRIL